MRLPGDMLTRLTYPSPGPHHTKTLPGYFRGRVEAFFGAQVPFLNDYGARLAPMTLEGHK